MLPSELAIKTTSNIFDDGKIRSTTSDDNFVYGSQPRRIAVLVDQTTSCQIAFLGLYLQLQSQNFVEDHPQKRLPRFESHLQCKSTRIGRNENDGFDATMPPTLSVFNQPGRQTEKCKRRFLTDQEMATTALYVLLNCDEVKPFLT
ncbi:hypothetical protein ACH5RR_036581 [Cinchona calisaya]|uniref:Uncharacterized protein n=1 Tax=Cinchona calisaya TaxID=153742 RepID=A0ABD2Y6S9_9GENT